MAPISFLEGGDYLLRQPAAINISGPAFLSLRFDNTLESKRTRRKKLRVMLQNDDH